jgi:hypothetical protein
MFSLLVSIVRKFDRVKLELPSYPLGATEELESDVHIWLVILSAWIKDQLCLCCTALRDLIFVDWNYANDLRITTCSGMHDHRIDRYSTHNEYDVNCKFHYLKIDGGNSFKGKYE